MSPAPQTGGLHLERYLGSYLVSSSRSPHHQVHPEYDGCGGNGKAAPPKPAQFLAGHGAYRGGYVPADGLFCPPPFCQSRSSWAGVPLISTAGHRRGGKPPQPGPHSPPYHHQRVPVVNAGCNLDYGDGQQIPLSKLALHTRGAPLILSRRYNNNGNRKQNQYQNNTRQFTPFGLNRAPVVPDMVKKMKDIPKENRFEFKDHPVVSRTPIQNVHLVSNIDSLSVTSDESSGSAHSETCLPRIIKPRKRRKKDRKPLTNSIQEKGASDDIKLEPNDLTPDSTLLSLNPYVSSCHGRLDINHNTNTNYKPVSATSSSLDYMKVYASNEVRSKIEDGTFTREILQNSTSTPDTCAIRLVDDVDDSESDDSSSLFEAISRCSPTICQCRYCDPSGQTWDIDQHRYTPLLTAPVGFELAGDKNPFVDKDSLLRRSWSEPCPGYSVENLRISDYDKCSTPHRSDPNITVAVGQPDYCGDLGISRSVGVIGAGRRTTKSLESPSTLDWKESITPQSQLVPVTLFKSSSSQGVSLEVSSAIVTSLNGHRDLEIKFFSTSPPAVVSAATSFVYPSGKECGGNSGSSEESVDSSKCVVTNVQSLAVQ